ncbi:hypothetical protein G5I_11644 [Acromyrmex echinatior]|uniref:Uncharacterized protein n=1 Tax=Acromyrmex echinatior TaxID=103372 RepID=F4X057_ACREC|nr:hypothetical protein G5I_11644 [Acromyrmex echinatior]
MDGIKEYIKNRAQGVALVTRFAKCTTIEGKSEICPGEKASKSCAKRIERQHDLTGKTTLRYKDGESPGEAPRGHEAA